MNIPMIFVRVPFPARRGPSEIELATILTRIPSSFAPMAVFPLLQYYREQWRSIPQPKLLEDVNSKTILVTGSNVGLGFEACIHFAKMGPKLLIATCRHLVKCELTRKSILESAPRTELCTWPLELVSFQNVRSFVAKFATDGNGTLNTLVLNAGVFPDKYIQTQDGWEVILQVNYLSNALLSILLLPYLINSSSPDSPSRLVFVSSFAHFFAPELKVPDSQDCILQTINQPEFGDSLARYRLSKLLGVMFIRELASRLPESTPLIACLTNPGFCESEITRSMLPKGWLYFFFTRLSLIRSTEEGSRTLVHAAVASDRSMHGRYLSCCEVSEESDFVFTPQGKACSAKIWDETMTILSGVDGRVSEIVERFLRAGP